MNSSTYRSTTLTLAVMALGMTALLGFAAENPQPLLDRFGDPLPHGAIRRFGTLRFRHALIEDVSFTPDGKRLIAGIGMNPLAVFDARTGRKLRDVGKSTGSSVLGTFAVSADGKWIAACGENVFLWDIETGRLIRELQLRRCRTVVFSADGKSLAVASATGGRGTEITLIEVATGKHLRKWTFQEGERLSFNSRSLAFSPEGKYLAGLFCKNRKGRPDVIDPVSAQVWLLDAKSGSRVRTFGATDALIGAFAFQPGAGRLATIEKNGALRFWDVATGKETQHFSVALGKWVNKDRPAPEILRFSAEGSRCVVADGTVGLLVVVDARTGRELRRIKIAKTATMTAADLSSDGRTIACVRPRRSCVRVWDVDTGVERLGDAGHRTPPMLSLSAEERTLIGRDDEGQVIHWDRRSGQAVQRRNETPGQDGRPIQPLGTSGEWTRRGPRWRLSYHFETSKLTVHSLHDDRLIAKAEWPGYLRDFVMSPDGASLATTLLDDSLNTVLLWNPEKEKKPRRLSGNVDRFRRLFFSHDSKRLIATALTRNAYPSSALWVWDVAMARPIHKLVVNSALGSLLLTADDRVLIYGGFPNDGMVHVWDMETAKELASFTDPPSKERGSIGGLALSADERFVAVLFNRDDAYTVSVWETGSWKAVRIFPPAHGRNSSGSMVFSRDGRSLFVANRDTTILE